MDRISERLRERRQKNLYRALQPAEFRKEGKIFFQGREYVDFSSNDYLGLSCHPHLLQAARDAAERFGVGAGASRLLSGDYQMHHKLEEQVAAFKNKEKALIYNSGYQANVGIISALYKKGDAVFADRFSHASIIDGIALSGARLFRFQHNDMRHLELLLKSEREKFHNALIITETVFSMDGDRCPLKETVVLKKKYKCRLFVDEAHATGIFGKNAGGADLIMGTFSKALGSFGAYLAGRKEIIDYLINYSRSFIYSTALPPPVVAANLAGLELVRKESGRRKALLENAEFFRRRLQEAGFTVKGNSQIVPLILGDSRKAQDLSRKLRKHGYWVCPIRPPTVPAGQARLRFSLTYHHNKEILNELIERIKDAYKI